MKTKGKIGEIAFDLRGFIEEHARAPHQWYVGLAADAEEKLFKHHKVKRHRDSWIYRMADSPEVARTIQENFLKLGCDGEPRPDEPKASVVYVYLKSRETTP